MDKFEIKVLNSNNFNYDIIIFSKSYDSPFDYLDDLEQEIRSHSKSSKMILFDSLLTTGNTSDRFIEAHFNDDGFDYDSFKITDLDRSSPLRKYCSDFFSKNREILECSILPSIQVKMLCRGMVI